MPEDFTAVPRDEWWKVAARSSDALWIAIGALALAVLIVMKLISKGVVGSWADLLVTGSPGV